MTDLQNKELEILEKFIEVCNKLNLTYYLVCGSVLGAVKYGGFIPWDDDIDVALPRDDYEIFIEKAQNFLPDNLFVQTYKTDSDFPQIYCKLRDSNTTFIEKSAADLHINHGVFIDVFPLDGYPKKRIKKCLLETRKRIYQSMLLSAYRIERNGKSKLLYQFYQVFHISNNTKKVVCRYERLIRKYSLTNSNIWCNHGNWQGKLEYAAREQYGDGTEAVFEGLKVRIPEKYDEYLTQKYGDWKSDLPDEQKVGHHYYTICDLDRSYIYYTQ